MIKRLIAVFLTFAMLSCITLSVSAENPDYIEVTEGGAATSTLLYCKSSEYEILIPYEINANVKTQLEATYVNIVYEDTFVCVWVINTDENNQVKFEHQFREGVYFTATPKYEAVSNDVFVPNEIPGDNNNFVGVFDTDTSSNVYMIWETDESEKRIEAGDYKATVTFYIGLEMKDKG